MPAPIETPVSIEDSSSRGDHQSSEKQTQESSEQQTQQQIQPRRPSRTIHPPSRLRDFVTNQVTYPIQNFFTLDNVKPHFKAFLLNLDNKEPTSFYEAINYSVWKQAMFDEFQALEKNHTWDLVSLPIGKKTGRMQVGLQD
jgi:hypothetical protein